MAMVDVRHIAAYRQTCSPSQVAWSEGWQLPGTDLHILLFFFVPTSTKPVGVNIKEKC